VTSQKGIIVKQDHSETPLTSDASLSELLFCDEPICGISPLWTSTEDTEFMKIGEIIDRWLARSIYV
jgi:hypothetical protein